MSNLEKWEQEIEKVVKSLDAADIGKLKRAIEFARDAHEGAYRKGTHDPYIVHPFEVCCIASAVTDDVDVLITALLHDVVEDTDHTIEEVRELFGERVAQFVSDESEDKMDNLPKSLSWLIRKEKFIEHLETAPIQSQTVCMSDKVSNLRAMARDYRDKGDSMWEIFHQRDPARHAWYYRMIAQALYKNFGKSEPYKEYIELYHYVFEQYANIQSLGNGEVTMEVVKTKSENGIVYIKIGGRITSANADELYEKLNAISEEYPGQSITFDVAELEMISSAGLRVFLKIKKAGVDFKIINASPDVYDVFDITGFVEMFEITKALRKFDISNKTIIGEGAKGIVFKIDDETIIKVYKDDDCTEEIEKERAFAKKALVSGVPTAIPFDIVMVGDHYGSVFELVDAKSVTKACIDNPDNADELIREYARVMKEMNSISDDGELGFKLPHMHDEVDKWIKFIKERLTEEQSEKIVKVVGKFDNCNTLVHGDGHPNNAMVTKDGILFIDMDTLCVGDPLFDLMVVYTALIGFKVVDPGNDFIPIPDDVCALYWKIFLEEYYKELSEEERAQKEYLCKVLCYMRLFRRGILKERKKPHFAENAKRELLSLIS